MLDVFRFDRSWRCGYLPLEAVAIVFASSQNQRHEIICRACDGSGTFDTLAFGASTCDGCHGSGVHTFTRSIESCRECNGKGVRGTFFQGEREKADGSIDCFPVPFRKVCERCHGSGFVETRWRLRQAITRAIGSAADAVRLLIVLAAMVYVVFLFLGALWPWGGTLGWLLQIVVSCIIVAFIIILPFLTIVIVSRPRKSGSPRVEDD